jgi:hypothetical protein
VSTIVMTACWPLQMSSTQKAVLVSLADQANDDGVCWPRVETISIRTCLSERAVQIAIRWLADHGALRLERRYKRSTVFTVTPADFRKDADCSGERGSGEESSGEQSSGEDGSGERDSVSGERGALSGAQITAFSGERRAPRTVKEPSKEPSRNISSPPSSAARGSRLPKDWVLTKKLAVWALTEQPTWTAEHVRKVADSFKDHWDAKPGKDGRKTDWDATWRNWVRNSKPLASGTTSTSDAPAADWWLSDSGIGAQGKRVGVDRRGPRESTPDYLIRVAKASGRGPWIEYVLKREQGASRYPQIVEFFGDALLPSDFGS